jgi:hypothetical protein
MAQSGMRIPRSEAHRDSKDKTPRMPRCCSSRAVPACRKGQRAAPAKEVHERLAETPATARNTEPGSAARTERPAGGWIGRHVSVAPSARVFRNLALVSWMGAYFPIRVPPGEPDLSGPAGYCPLESSCASLRGMHISFPPLQCEAFSAPLSACVRKRQAPGSITAPFSAAGVLRSGLRHRGRLTGSPHSEGKDSAG